jgi:hypothetical protein
LGFPTGWSFTTHQLAGGAGKVLTNLKKQKITKEIKGFWEKPFNTQ